MRIFSSKVEQSLEAFAQGSGYQFDDEKYHKVLEDVKGVYHDYVVFNDNENKFPTLKNLSRTLKIQMGNGMYLGKKKQQTCSRIIRIVKNLQKK